MCLTSFASGSVWAAGGGSNKSGGGSGNGNGSVEVAEFKSLDGNDFFHKAKQLYDQSSAPHITQSMNTMGGGRMVYFRSQPNGSTKLITRYPPVIIFQFEDFGPLGQELKAGLMSSVYDSEAPDSETYIGDSIPGIELGAVKAGDNSLILAGTQFVSPEDKGRTHFVYEARSAGELMIVRVLPDEAKKCPAPKMVLTDGACLFMVFNRWLAN